jgi:hypothetical protein
LQRAYIDAVGHFAKENYKVQTKNEDQASANCGETPINIAVRHPAFETQTILKFCTSF